MRILEKILGRREATRIPDLPPRVPLGVEEGGAWWPLRPSGHLLVAGDPGRPAGGLTRAAPLLYHLREMLERRLELLTVEGVTNLDDLNEARAARGEEALRSITVSPDDIRSTLADGCGDAADPLRRACLEDLERIMRDGRPVGVYIWL